MASPSSANPAQPSSSDGRRRLRWPGIVFPLLFLLLAAIMVYLVLDLSELLPHSKNYREIPQLPEKQQPVPSAPNAVARAQATVPATPSSPSPIIKAGHKAPDPVGIPGVAPPSLIEDRDLKVNGEVRLPPKIDLSKANDTPLPEPARSSETIKAARTQLSPSKVLQTFLEAKTLSERRPYLSDSRRSESVLAAGPLARPLPQVVSQRSLHYMENKGEQHIEHFYEISFQRSPDITPIPILVQLNEWGDGNIMVHTDAFLDLYNDELAAFGRAPVEGERTFHVVADAYKHCFDERIPDASKKSFIKLRAHPRITPRLKAYFGRNSPLSDQISQPDALPWGSSGVCTVTVKWNTSTPDRPFVELVRIEGFTWNP